MILRLAPALTLAALTACAPHTAPAAASPADAAHDASTDVAADTTPDATTTPATCDTTERAVSLQTEDGVTLVADWRDASSGGQGAVVLLHMIPPGNDRSTWPARVRDTFAALDLTVVTLDRRGAGDSGGEPQDAYTGDGGRLDVEAVVRALVASPCTVDIGDITLIGASNGSTSVWDYTAGHAASLPDPARLAFLSPGTYTEAQRSFQDERAIAEATPMLWIYPDSEPYSSAFVADAPSTWQFERIEGGRHGTGMFDDGALEAQVLPLLTTFAAGAAPR